MVNVQRLAFVEFIRDHADVEIALIQYGSQWIVRADLIGTNVGIASQRSGAGPRCFKTLDSAYRQAKACLDDAGRKDAVVRVFAW